MEKSIVDRLNESSDTVEIVSAMEEKMPDTPEVEIYENVVPMEDEVSPSSIMNIGGGYNRKTFYTEGICIRGQSSFYMDYVGGPGMGALILGAQLILVENFGICPWYWNAYWETVGLFGQAISDYPLLDVIGAKVSKFYDAASNSPIAVGNPYIRIDLDDGINPVNAGKDGKVIGFVYYIEMPDMKLP